MVNNLLTAVVLAAGKGSRVNELTTSCAKCLLPVANKPIIYYPLETLIRSNFKEVIVVVSDTEEEVISKALNDLKMSINIILEKIPYSRDFGTADSLRLIKDKIKNDILVMSCDTITDFPLKRLIDWYLIYNPTLLSLISLIPPNNESTVPGRKGRDKIEKDLIGIDANNGDRLVFLSSEADFDESVEFSVSMLKKCPQFSIKSNLLDSHIYILKKWTLKYLEDNNKISSLKSEFLPSLVRKQFRKQIKSFANKKTSLNPSSIISSSALPLRNIADYIDMNDIELTLNKLEPNVVINQLTTDKMKKEMPNTYPESKIKCFAFCLNEGYCIRANTLSGFCEANRMLLKQMNTSDKKPIKSQSSISSKSQIDAIVGNNNKIGDKCSIKRSIIGNNCIIGDKVKIMNSIIMDNVVIEEGSNIQGSVICLSAKIQSNVEIKDCVIASNQIVHSLAKLTNEVLMDLDQMMEL
ncbi:translation initiation factor eIF-2B subunit gamma-like [Oppia nitens]|uniref:translation initiation factor eIF-2B subunit gamma-like n=1 Tax=Oppia nitens TaxID=1686743 RepID=UPI0023DCB702|nr:translation initiation factor eIF-2B subunit gamma-like [Oppia nitens]